MRLIKDPRQTSLFDPFRAVFSEVVGTRESARPLKMSPNTERKCREALETKGLYDGPVGALPTLAPLREAVSQARSAAGVRQRSGIAVSWIGRRVSWHPSMTTGPSPR